MDLVYSVALLGLAVILFNGFLLGVRMPDTPGWAAEGVLADLWCTAIAGLIVFGAAFGVRFAVAMNELEFGLKEAALVATVLAACYLIVRMMAPRRRLAEYAGELARRRGASEPSPENVVALGSPEGNDRTPSGPTLPKAA